LIAINPDWLQTSGGDQAIHNDTTVTGGGARAICLWALAALFSLFIFPSFKRNKGEKKARTKIKKHYRHFNVFLTIKCFYKKL
jgi:hypothetical protein